jgi:hypothetical protein
MPNRLANETSPYLLQHQNNPVDWYPWGEEAFAKARAEDKPVFLSVGYSSCHWCHVMEHESFEDPEVARLLNENFVSVKVDREERPDVDEAYMTAVQLGSGRGGWPMSVFMTPDRKPFFAGTYFPKEDRGQYPGFTTLCRQIGLAWQSKRRDLQETAERYDEALRETLTTKVAATSNQFDEQTLAQTASTLISDFDQTHGGFGGAPKFPPHSALEFLMAYALRLTAKQDLREASLGVSLYTLEKMALGGIHDQVGGGFHRYSTDAEWLLPHFEKMLYDNALLLSNFARAAGIAHGLDPAMANLFVSAAQGIIDWLQREMTAPEGFFYSALDADSEGEEGKFYVWTVKEVQAVLGEDADAFLHAFNFKAEGNFRDEATGHQTGANIPHASENLGQQFVGHLRRLREAREARVRPGLDDKALVSWNGLMIGALADAGVPHLAERAAVAILEHETAHGTLPHQIAKGRPSGEGFLDDYANFVDGLIKLASFKEFLAEQGQPAPGLAADDLREHARRLAVIMVDRFYDRENGAFYSTSAGHEELFGRTKPVFDQPVPSGNAMAVRVLLEIGDVERARESVSALLGWMQRAPHATEALYASAMGLLSVPDRAPENVAPAPEPAPVVAAAPAQVAVSVPSRELRADANGLARGEVRLQVPDGLHLNSENPPARWLTPTRVETQPVKATIEYPAAQADQYTGEVVIPFTVQIPPGQEAVEFELKVSYQACTETECLLPTERRFDAVAFR